MLIEQKYQIIQVVRCAGKSILRRECKLEFSFKSHYSKCQRLCKNLWWISINYHQSIAFSYSSANQDFPNELTVKAARIYYISSEIIYRYNSTRWPVPDETNILEVWTENGKYICFLMTNIFVLKWQIYLFDFWQILFLKLEERSCFFRISYRKEVVLLLLLLYIKDFFWDIFRVSSLDTIVGELLDTGFTYLVLLSLSIVSLLRTVWWEWECPRRLFKFLFWARWLFTYFGLLSLAGAGTLSNILKHFQICVMLVFFCTTCL